MLRAKKHFGQHFLKDPLVSRRIAEQLQLRSKVLEVGPGMGILTSELLEIVEDLKVVELDDDAIIYLAKNEILTEKEIIKGDILKLDLSEVFGAEFSVIGNFPYYISSQIIFKMVENHALVPEMVGMFQKELAERICSGPGSKAFGVISVLTQSRYDTEYLFTLDENEFSPPPKVKSAVIRLSRKENALPEDRYKKLSQVVKMAFNQRRKTLRNSLKAFGDRLSIPEELSSKRPEACSLEEFLKMSDSLTQS